jgi:Uma2 family endonuclease
MLLSDLLTAEHFVAWAELPENADKRLEYINETVYDMTSNQKSSACAMRIAVPLGVFIMANDLGDMTGADGGYTVAGDYIVPDVAFISRQRQAAPPDETYNALAPDFVVEVISPSDIKNPQRIHDKISLYQRAKLPLAWFVYPLRREVEVYENGELTRTAGIDDILDGGAVLPGFTLVVKTIF